jgi:hypothetical protein
MTDVALGIAVLADVIIAAAMVRALQSHRSHFEKTRTLVRKLIIYTIATGMLTWSVRAPTFKDLSRSSCRELEPVLFHS